MPFLTTELGNAASLWKNVTFVDPVFLLAFLPAVLIASAAAQRVGRSAQIGVLIAGSLLFYASWGRGFLLLLIASILFNYTARQVLVSTKLAKARRAVLWLIVGVDLAVLGYFKYRGFFIETFANLVGQSPSPAMALILPLGVSFYTFQEIMLAVDAYRGQHNRSFSKYALFITFFPHLVAGPLVHHREMLPQFDRLGIRARHLAIGAALLVVGLFKKLCLADPLAALAAAAFDPPAGTQVQFIAAWIGTLAFTFQLYFDFSGYSDMALGLARLFGVKLPLNFNSPYKATNIIDFWRRWHMTLSRFLREYVYFGLGGNRLGPRRRYLNLMITMLLGGLWHGAAWTFVLWGGLHGLYLLINHAWVHNSRRPLPAQIGWLLTFLAVAVAWVPFRAHGFGQTMEIWAAMIGLAGVEQLGQLSISLADPYIRLAWLAVLGAICLLLPNTQELLRLRHPDPSHGSETTTLPTHTRGVWTGVRFRPGALWGGALGLVFGLALLARRELPTEFLYWNF